jgi:hypothetical protein
MSEKIISLPRGCIQLLIFLPIGRIKLDFGLYKIPYICGFTCCLVIVESPTTNQNTHLSSFVYGSSAWHTMFWVSSCLVTIIRTNGGGELWDSNNFHLLLFEEAAILLTMLALLIYRWAKNQKTSQVQTPIMLQVFDSYMKDILLMAADLPCK